MSSFRAIVESPSQDAELVLRTHWRLLLGEAKALFGWSVQPCASVEVLTDLLQDENCYGPDGMYHERRGWQQVADAASGCSYVMGTALGFEPGHGVLPSLPISDMSTGIVGAVTVLSMLRDRARFGGSYRGNAALTAFDVLTVSKEVGLYSPNIVKEIQDKRRFKPLTSDLHVIELYYDIVEAWKAETDYISNEKYYTHFADSVYGKDMRILKPLIEYTNPDATPRWSSPPVPFAHHFDVAWRQ